MVICGKRNTASGLHENLARPLRRDGDAARIEGWKRGGGRPGIVCPRGCRPPPAAHRSRPLASASQHTDPLAVSTLPLALEYAVHITPLALRHGRDDAAEDEGEVKETESLSWASVRTLSALRGVLSDTGYDPTVCTRNYRRPSSTFVSSILPFRNAAPAE